MTLYIVVIEYTDVITTAKIISKMVITFFLPIKKFFIEYPPNVLYITDTV